MMQIFKLCRPFNCLVSFWAQRYVAQGKNSNDRMQVFPPNMMRELGFLPEGCKKVNTPFEGPVLHTNTVA